MLRKTLWSALLVALSSSATLSLAADVKNSSDHPLLSRFPGAEIRSYSQKQYDAAVLPKSKIDNRKEPGELLEIEGKVTRIAYRIPGERSALEVMRNYEKALKKGGFETQFACAGQQECGKSMMAFIALEERVRPSGFGDAHFGSDPERALLAHRRDENADVHVFLHVVENPVANRTYLYQQIVEGAPLELDQVSLLQADELRQSLDRLGHVAVPGVYFDTAKADIKPESDAALSEMAKLLRSNSALKIYVVGHTDNQGPLDANIALSQARAQAVVDALRASHGIDGSRLAAKGVASFAPVASNTDEAGRARNRRVEIVLQ